MRANPHICKLLPYQPGLPINLVARNYGIEPKNIIKLASNENPFGMSPKAKTALLTSLDDAHRYPEQYNLLQALSQKLRVAPEQIVLGNGSNDVLDFVARTFLHTGDQAILSQYSFAIFNIATQSTGAKSLIVPAKNYSHDLPAMLRAITPQTRIVWIASPNNPTGTFAKYADVKQFLQSAPPEVIVVLDEAYFEYLPANQRADATTWLEQHPNLIITRTFSKIYGLAGLRIGYGITSPQVANLLNRVRQPFNANNLAIAAAVAALNDDDFVAKSFIANQVGRQQLIDGLQKNKLSCLPAYGNFVTFEAKNATGLNAKLLQQGIIVRPLANYDMPNHLRVSVGTTEENTKFLQSLKNAI